MSAKCILGGCAGGRVGLKSRRPHLEDGDKVAAIRMRPFVEALALLDDDAWRKCVVAQALAAGLVALNGQRRGHELFEGGVLIQLRLSRERLQL